MPNYGLRYVKECDVSVADRDKAAAIALADGAATESLVLVDDAGIEHETLGLCDVCAGVVWVDQAHVYEDGDMLMHRDCPAPSSPLDTAITLNGEVA